MKLDPEQFAGELWALQAILMALIRSHPDPKRVDEALGSCGAAVMTLAATSGATNKTRDAMRERIATLRKLASMTG